MNYWTTFNRKTCYLFSGKDILSDEVSLLLHVLCLPPPRALLGLLPSGAAFPQTGTTAKLHVLQHIINLVSSRCFENFKSRRVTQSFLFLFLSFALICVYLHTFKIYLFEHQSFAERERNKEWEIFHPLVHCPDGHNRCHGPRLKSSASSCFRVPHTGRGTGQLTPKLLVGLDWKWNIWDLSQCPQRCWGCWHCRQHFTLMHHRPCPFYLIILVWLPYVNVVAKKKKKPFSCWPLCLSR